MNKQKTLISINELEFIRLKQNLHAISKNKCGIGIQPDPHSSVNLNSSLLPPQFEKYIDSSNQDDNITIEKEVTITEEGE